MQVVITDTGPLWSFSEVGRLDLLGARLAGRVQWTTAVVNEISRNAVSHPHLNVVLTQTWLPSPVELSGVSLDLVREANRVRGSLAVPTDHPMQHLGEAEAIVYAKSLPEASVLTEDQAAARRARFEGLTVRLTTDVLNDLVIFGEATENEVWGIYVQLSTSGRLPSGITRQELFR